MTIGTTRRQLSHTYGTLRASANTAALCLSLLEVANLCGQLDTNLFTNLVLTITALLVFASTMHRYRKHYLPVSPFELRIYGLDANRWLGGAVYAIIGGVVLVTCEYLLKGDVGLAGAAAIGSSLGWATGFYLLPELDYYAAVRASKPVTVNN